jgi:hypothetical protein
MGQILRRARGPGRAGGVAWLVGEKLVDSPREASARQSATIPYHGRRVLELLTETGETKIAKLNKGIENLRSTDPKTATQK